MKKMKEQVVQQGAEAILIKRDNELIKRRVGKGYRLKELDEKLRRSRTKKEAKLLEKVAEVIAVPKLKKVSEFEIDMEFVEGKKLSEHLDSLKNWGEVCFKIGSNIAKLHDLGIIHGDLTTSNMIYVEESKLSGEDLPRHHSPHYPPATERATEEKVYFIDFGLGFHSNKVEDKAVELHLLKQALEAKHFKNYEKFFEKVLEGYKISESYSDVLKRFEKVEKRGRYKTQY